MNLENLKPVGSCIYCGSQTSLSREHIIPYALQGNWVLPKASCPVCARITSEFERKVLRDSLSAVRRAAGFRTRRPHEQPTDFPQKITKHGEEISLRVPIEDHLTLLLLPLVPTAAYIDKRKYVSGVDIIGTETLVFGDDPTGIARKLDAQSISVTETYDYTAFLRLIAKIGYCIAVARYGLDSIAKPYVLPSILGQNDDIGMWVGSDGFQTKAENDVALHVVQGGIGDINGENLIMVKVKLFADAHPTGYHVIVGQAR